jgi:DNA-binding response OmpR family regulator
VLLVESDHALGDRIQRSLAAVGLRTERAVSGQQALALLARTQPALLLLALDLPDMFGEAVARAARERYGDALPIVVLSAVRRQDPRLPPVKAAAVLPQPLVLDDLLRLVARFVPPAPGSGGPAPP